MLKVKLFIAPGCPHCPNVLQALSELIKDGEIAEMEVSNMALVPEKAQELNIRSVPWIKIGPLNSLAHKAKVSYKPGSLVLNLKPVCRSILMSC
ncbi:MAG: thioredoxin family protein [gamma proteobacterium symbiont of Lucinoma myriamae]|nr:thioredoxin family protein [gamma proteobacterium symbiont of Lucinoma myriamae]MCU7818508.1 thioredoxin family protein [gamma proteobacterium symbiont of Lucinoma myriamae]MCU7833502.1 thioredoxin family protein [gamma proteobacterium symbiont of Lucinoma myriamae]